MKFKRFRNIGLGFKLTALFIVIIMVALGVTGILSYRQASNSLTQRAEERMIMARDLKGDMIESYFGDTVGDLEIIANLPLSEESLPLFAEAFRAGFDSQAYQDLEREYGDDFEEYVQRLGLYDLFLIDLEGNIIYSVEKESDLGTNLEDGRYSDSALAEAYRLGRNRVNLTDFEVYDVHGEAASFVAGPVKDDETDELLGVIAFEMPIDQINAIMQDQTGMGESGETYLVGDDYLMRSDSRFRQESTILEQEVRMDSTDAALAGGIGLSIVEDYRGENVFSAYTPLNILDQDWVLLADIDYEEIMAPVYTLRNIVLIVALVVLVVATLLTTLVVNKIITNPIKKINGALNKLANKDLNIDLKHNAEDEIGEIVSNLNQTIGELNNSLLNVWESSNVVSNGAEEISTGNQDLSQRTEEQASSLEEFSSTVEEIASSINASSANASEADNLSSQTLKSVNRGEEVVDEMQGAMVEITKSSKDIAEIISKVNDIAFQTNLLALNAAVEAARAGEAGQGFAVVAAEVRNLASRAAESADEIENLITVSIERIDKGNELMSETDEVLTQIVTNAQKITDVVGEIAASLKEQSVATDEIQNAVEELNQVTQQNASLVEEVASASENMNAEAVELSGVVNRFQLDRGEQGRAKRRTVENRSKKKKDFNEDLEQSQRARSKEMSEVIEDDLFSEDDFEKF